MGQGVPFNFVADSIHTKKLCSRLSSSEVHLVYWKRPSPFKSSLENLEATYTVHHTSHWEARIVYFLLVIIDLLSLVLYERISTENRRLCLNGVSLAQNFTYKGSPHQPFFVSENYLSFGIRMCARVYFVLSQFKRLTDGQTDGHFAHGCALHGKNITSNMPPQRPWIYAWHRRRENIDSSSKSNPLRRRRQIGGTARRWEAEDRNRCHVGETSETWLQIISRHSAVADQMDSCGCSWAVTRTLWSIDEVRTEPSQDRAYTKRFNKKIKL